MKCYRCGEENPDPKPTLTEQLFPEAALRSERDEQTRRADRWMYRYHVAAKLLQDWLTPQTEETGARLAQRTGTLLAAVDQGHDEAKALVDEVHWLRRVRKAVFDNNAWLSSKLEKLDAVLAGWEDDPARDADYKLLSDILHSSEGQPLVQDCVPCSFSFDRNPAQPLESMCPGDGYGILKAIDTKVNLTFDCGHVFACADISYEYLDKVLREAGLTVVETAFLERAQAWLTGRSDASLAEWRALEQRAEKAEKRAADEKERVLELEGELRDSVEDRRVLDAVDALSVRALEWLGASPQVGAGPFTYGELHDISDLAKFAIAKRIADAVLQVPWYWDDERIRKTPLPALLNILERAEVYGAELRAMSKDERDRHYEAWVHGRVDDVSMQIRDVQADGASEPKPD